jgi:transposase
MSVERAVKRRCEWLTIGLDFGARSSCYCVLDAVGDVLLEQKVSTTPKAMRDVFGVMPRCRIAPETRTHSPWASRLLSGVGHETIVADARDVRLIGESKRRDDRMDAFTPARLVRIDPQLLCPVKHRSAEAQADLIVIRARAALIRNRTTLVNAARGLTKSDGEKLSRGSARSMRPKAAQDLSPELKNALGSLMKEIESVSERIRDYEELLESMAQTKYAEAERQKQIKGVGTLIALTYMQTLEDPHRLHKSRDAACYVGLQPGRRNSNRVSRRCISAKMAIRTCDHCWCRQLITYWGHGEPTATCYGGE